VTAWQEINVAPPGISTQPNCRYAAVSGSTIQGVAAANGPLASALGAASAPGLLENAKRLHDDPQFSAGRMFAAVFGVWPATYTTQPGIATVECGGGCGSEQVNQAIAQNPGMPLLLNGDVALSGGDIGSAAEPAVLVVTGNFTFAANTTVTGLIYVRNANWATAGAGTVVGAVVGEGRIGGNGTFSVIYDETVLETARRTMGSYVLIPGGWLDYP
jgi:hypothetical protein